MRLAVIAFAAGVWLLQRQAELPGAVALAAMAMALGLAVAGLAVLARSVRTAKATASAVMHLPMLYLRWGAWVAAFGLLGFFWAALCANGRMADRLDPAWEGRDIEITGVISSLSQPFERGVRFEFDIESVAPAEARVPQRVLLAWYNGLTREEFQEVAPVRAGERWRFAARLKRPHGQSNPTGFDYEASLIERGIRATGTVRARILLANGRGGAPERLDAMVTHPAYVIERLREHVRERFWDALPEHRYAGVLTALAIGDQKAIESQEWDVFTRTGVNHLMSISCASACCKVVAES